MILGNTELRLDTKNTHLLSIGGIYEHSTRPPSIMVVEPETKIITRVPLKFVRKAFAEELYQLTIVGGQSIIADDRTLILTSEGYRKPSSFRNMQGRNFCRVINQRPQVVFFNNRKIIEAYLTHIKRHYCQIVYEVGVENQNSCFIANGFVLKFISEEV